MHGDAAAEVELETLHLYTFDEAALKIFDLFLYLHDRTPLSIAFTQKVLLFFVDHIHLIQGYEKSAQSDEIKRRLEQACHWYENYLRAAADDHTQWNPY